ncbi:MAG: hypothetical protein MJ169_05170 [Treponema sp.]|nr:hypothetical protein [Treponema sp.]
MAKKSKDYFGLGWLVSVILCLFLGPILGIVTRLMEGKIVAALLRLLLGWNIIWLIDLIMMIMKGQIWRLLKF